jgi:hypothetical protein
MLEPFPFDAGNPIRSLRINQNNGTITRIFSGCTFHGSIEEFASKLSDFIQEGIESGTFDNQNDLRASVLNFLTFHQKQA